MNPSRLVAALALGVAALSATLFAATPVQAQEPKATTVASGLQNPWGLAFLPDGRMLVTERPGRMRVVEKDGKLGAPLAGLPPVVAGGQGGLLDVALHPQFAANRLVYWSYSEGADDGNSTAVARGRLEEGRLADVQVVFRQQPKFSSSSHFGGRLVFARDGRLFVTLGDRFRRRDDAQTLDNHHGKVVRIEADGRVPADNPFVGKPGALPEIWSWGHRNVQGAAIHPATGALWTHEHGPQGGDELNLTEAGRNHGWPVITQGREYVIGSRIGEGTARADIAPAATTWVPSIAPSGLAFVTTDRYPGWKGSVLVGALKARRLVRLELDGNRVVREHRLLDSLDERIRDVREAPDGRIWLLTDSSDGRIVRLD
jgi:glucose/arabinose dehydrogenase